VAQRGCNDLKISGLIFSIHGSEIRLHYFKLFEEWGDFNLKWRVIANLELYFILDFVCGSCLA